MKRIFICAQPSMFSEGLEACLAGTPGLEVVGHAVDPASALQRIQALQPDTVLLITPHPPGPHSAAAHAWIDKALESIWRAGNSACCIELSLHDNHVHVFRGEQAVVTDLDDLVAIMEQTLVGHPAGPASQGTERDKHVRAAE